MINNTFLHFLSLQLITNFKRYRALSIVAILIVFILSSTLFISSSIKVSMQNALKYQPDFIVQKLVAGQSSTAPISWEDKLLQIPGVSKVTPRVYGRYYFSKNKSALIVGIDFFEEQSSKALLDLTKKVDIKALAQDKAMLIGNGVNSYLKAHFYSNNYNFLTPNGDFIKLKIEKILDNNTSLFSNDMVITSMNVARKILGIKSNEVSDFALSIPNKVEQNTIKEKIEALYYNINVVTKKDMKRFYKSLYDYKSGIFLVLFLITLFTFSLILYLRYLIATSIERKEIGILRAIGWSIKDILKLKFYENITIVVVSFILGVVGAYIFVFILNAPILKDIFLGSQNLKNSLKFVVSIDYGTIATIFIVYALTFLASTLIPIWRIAITDPKEAMK